MKDSLVNDRRCFIAPFLSSGKFEVDAIDTAILKCVNPLAEVYHIKKKKFNICWYKHLVILLMKLVLFVTKQVSLIYETMGKLYSYLHHSPRGRNIGDLFSSFG